MLAREACIVYSSYRICTKKQVVLQLIKHSTLCVVFSAPCVNGYGYVLVCLELIALPVSPPGRALALSSRTSTRGSRGATPGRRTNTRSATSSRRTPGTTAPENNMERAQSKSNDPDPNPEDQPVEMSPFIPPLSSVSVCLSIRKGTIRKAS